MLHTGSPPRSQPQPQEPKDSRSRTEGEREMDPIPAKRLRMTTVSVGGGGAGAVMPVSPSSRKLRQSLLVVLFLVSLKNTVTVSLSQIGRMVQRHVDHAIHKYHGLISSKLESLEAQIGSLRQEVKQLACLYSNRQADQCTRLEPNREDGSNTSFRLCFQNDYLQTPIYTEENIAAANKASIKIGIFEGHTKITTGPLSELEVDIMVLRGDFADDGRRSWTEKEFNSHIVQGRDGHGFVLGGRCVVRLINGEASLGRLRFKEGSSRTRSRQFVIGARVRKSENTGGIRIQEAVMKPVTVQDRRNKANMKNHPPKLDDEVYRLEEISKDGTYHKRLQEARIFTVHDFLKALNKNAKKLREVLQMKKQHNSFVKMVKHAEECCLREKYDLKAYENEETNVRLFFNCVYQLVGAEFQGAYVTHENFDEGQKAQANKLKECAYDVLEDISFDYVMKNNIPVQICTSSNAAAGPSFPNPFDQEMSHQVEDTAAAVNLGHDKVSCVTDEPLPATEQRDPLGQANSYGSIEYGNHGYLGGHAARFDVSPDLDMFTDLWS